MGGMFYGMYPWSKKAGCNCGEGDGGYTGEGVTEEQVKALIDGALLNFPTNTEMVNALRSYVKTNDMEEAIKNHVTDTELAQILRTYALNSDVSFTVEEHAKKIASFYLGHVRADRKTAQMTSPVGIDEEGRLWVAPSGGGGEQQGQIVKTFVKTSDMTNAVGIDDNGALWTTPFEGQVLRPIQKTSTMTEPVGVDSDGKLWVKPSEGGGGSVNLPFIDAREFGVDTAVEDNATPINNALLEAERRGGGIVLLPVGILKIKTSIVMRPKVKLMGQGALATVISVQSTLNKGGAIFIPQDCIGFTICDLGLLGNTYKTDGIIFADVDHSGGEQDLAVYWQRMPSAGEKVKYKSGFIHRVFITKFGTWRPYRIEGYDEVYEHFGINMGIGSNYNMDIGNCWIYQNENGLRITASDGMFHDSVVEGSAFNGFWNVGGNWKFCNLKVIWNGFNSKPNSSIYAIKGSNDYSQGRANWANVELQDNLCNDVMLQGSGFNGIMQLDNSEHEWRKKHRLYLDVKATTLTINATAYKTLDAEHCYTPKLCEISAGTSASVLTLVADKQSFATLGFNPNDITSQGNVVNALVWNH